MRARQINTLLSLVLILAAASCARHEANELRVSEESTAQIINGTLVRKRDTAASKSVVRLQILKDGYESSACTAVLIGRETVLTAAHCFDPKLIGPFDNVKVQFLVNPNDENAQWAPVSGFKLHPLYNTVALDVETPVKVRGKWKIETNREIGKAYDHDLAVAHFAGGLPVGFNTVAFDTDVTANYANSDIAVYGYGLSKDWNMDGTPGIDENQYHLRRGRFLVASVFDMNSDNYRTVAGPETTSWICQGDSGGPNFSVNGATKVVGINSSSGNEKVMNRILDEKTNTWKAVLSCKSSGKAIRVAPFAPWISSTRQTLINEAKAGPRSYLDVVSR